MRTHMQRFSFLRFRLGNCYPASPGVCCVSHVSNLQTNSKEVGFTIPLTRYKTLGHRHRLCSSITPNCDSRCSQISYYHVSSRRLDDAKSLADKTVQILSESKRKEEEQKKKDGAAAIHQGEQEILTKPDQPAIEVTQAADASKPTDSAPQEHTVQISLPRRVWRKIVKEVKHYYNGFRLLFIDVKICNRYIWGVLNGKTLTRRERKQLVRTTADLFRLVPFSVFVIVPFMEFLLPVALKLFPGLLPSTFAEKDKEKEKVKKRLKAKLEYAKFLQDTIEESALVKSGTGKHTELAKEFHVFLKEIREHGTTVKTADILKFTQLFKDDITLDNMSRDHLVALCRLLELNTIGTNKMIAFQLRMKLRQLKADDKLINKEGIGSLSETELQQACRARGMRAIGVPEWRLRYQLKQWLDMHLNDKIPLSLLLMSRALYLPDNLSKEEQLKTIISTLPENTTAEAEIHAAEVTGEAVDPAAKLKLIKAEEEAIAREKEEEEQALLHQQRDKAEQLLREKAERELELSLAQESKEILSTWEDLRKYSLEDKAELIETSSKVDVTFDEKPKESTSTGHTDLPPDTVSDSADQVDVAAIDQELSHEDLEVLEDVLEVIAEEKKIGTLEKESLEALKEDVDEYQEDLTQLKSLVERDVHIGESKSAKRLSNRVNRMISSLTNVTDDLHQQKQQLLEEIEVKQVRMRRSGARNEEALQNLRDAIEKEKDDVISINELVLSMKRLQKVPDDTRLQKIAEVLDEDKDGQISLSHVLRVLQELGTENVNLKGSQMTEIIELLKIEETLENEEKEKEKEEKQKQSSPDKEKIAEVTVAAEAGSSNSAKAKDSSL